MKKLTIILFTIFFAAISKAQDFKANITTARTAYATNKLEDAHFALQQALAEIDMIIGKEVLKLLPAKMDVATVNTSDDHVTSNVGFVGATVHRSYGTPGKAEIEIISNSPMVASLNLILNTPMLGGMMRDENNKTVKVQGYKGRLEKQGSDATQLTYVLQLPFSGALLTFTVHNTSEAEITTLANTLPLQQIAKLVQ